MAANTTYTFGLDVSKYQGTINWDSLASQTKPSKASFVAIRGGISWAYKDPEFDRNWAESKRLNVPRMAYFVIYPNEDPMKQVDNWMKILGDDIGDLPPVIDVELHGGINVIHKCTPAKYQATLYNALAYLETRSGVTPTSYTGSYFMDGYVIGGWPYPVPTWLNRYNWWLAQYLKIASEHPGPPRLCRGLDRSSVIIQQTSDKGVGFGVESDTVDYNRWQDETAKYKLQDLLISSIPDPVEPPVEPPVTPNPEPNYVKMKEIEYDGLMKRIGETDANGEELHRFAKNIEVIK